MGFDPIWEIGIWHLTPFEIGILGFQDPPYTPPILCIVGYIEMTLHLITLLANTTLLVEVAVCITHHKSVFKSFSRLTATPTVQKIWSLSCPILEVNLMSTLVTKCCRTVQGRKVVQK